MTNRTSSECAPIVGSRRPLSIRTRADNKNKERPHCKRIAVSTLLTNTTAEKVRPPSFLSVNVGMAKRGLRRTPHLNDCAHSVCRVCVVAPRLVSGVVGRAAVNAQDGAQRAVLNPPDVPVSVGSPVASAIRHNVPAMTENAGVTI